MKLHSRLLLLAVLGLSSLALTRGADAAKAALPNDPTVLIGRLENGLTYFIQRHAKPQKRVELRLVVNAGSVFENDDQRGVAHLIEHLCFRCSRHFPDGELVHALQAMGVEVGPHANAETGFDETVYRLSLPIEAGVVPGKVWDVFLDWAGGVGFDPDEVEKERRVVVEEWRVRLGARQRLIEQELPVMFPDSRYADRLPIGKKETIETVPVSRIERFYRDWYRPDNMALVVVGDVDPAQVEAEVKRRFASLAKPTPALARPDASVKPPSEWRGLLATDRELASGVARIYYPQKARPLKRDEDFVAFLQRAIALGALNRRLEERRLLGECPYQIAQANAGRFAARDQEETQLFALADPAKVEDALEILVKEGERLKRWGLSAAEFEREKRETLKSFEQAAAQSEDCDPGLLGDRCANYFLRGDAILDSAWKLSRVRRAFEEMTLAEENKAVQSLFGSAGGLALVELPERGKKGELADAWIAWSVAEARKERLERYQEHQAPTALMEALPAPGKILTRDEVQGAGLTVLHLENGAQVVLKPSAFKKDEVLLSAFRSGGFYSLPPALDLAGKCVFSYQNEAGIGPFSKLDLEKLLAGKKVELGLPPDPNFDQIKGRCSAKDFETLLQLVHLAFGEPRRDPAAYDRMISLNQAFEANVALNPQAAFADEMLDREYGHHPRALRLIQPEQAWKTLDLDKILAARRARFSSAGGYTFVLVGDFSIDEAVSLAARYLGSLPGGAGGPGWTDVGIRLVPWPVEETLRRGVDPKALVVMSEESEAAWSASDAHLVWSLGNILQRTLWDRLRVDKTRVYSLQVSSHLEKAPYGHTSVQVVVPCAPDRAPEVVAMVDKECARLRTEGVSEEELQRELESQKADVAKQAEDNGAWLSNLELAYKYDGNLERVTEPRSRQLLLTRQNLKTAAERFLTSGRWVTYVLLPQGWTETKPVGEK